MSTANEQLTPALDALALLDEAQIESAIERETAELFKQLENLPDMRAVKVNSKALWAEDSKLRKAYQAACDSGARVAGELFLSQTPAAGNFRAKTTTLITKSGGSARIDISKFYNEVIDTILFSSHIYTTQKSILAIVNEGYSPAQNSNIWTRELPSYQIKRIASRCVGQRPNLDVLLNKCKTLGDCRKAILAAKAKLSPTKTVKALFVFTKTGIQLNGVSYPIVECKSGASSYKRFRVTNGKVRQWMRVETLKMLLGLPA